MAETPQTQPGKSRDDEIAVVPRTTFNYVIIAITFLVVGVAVGALAFTSESSPTESLTEADVERVVRSVLSDMDFSADANDDRFELVDNDPYLGAEDAPVVIVEFSDFRCPYCGRHYEQTMEPLMENYGEYIRYVYRDFAALGPESTQAALAAECANEQGVFWQFHDALFRNQQRISYDYYLELAADNDIDVDAFTACMTEGRYLAEIDNDIFDGQLNGVAGTPGFFVNGHFIRGAQPYDIFERLVLRELEAAGINPSS